MRGIIILLVGALSAHASFSQTNTFPASGNVGIGTTSPASKVHVSDAGTVEMLVGTTDATSSSRPLLSLQRGSSAGWNIGMNMNLTGNNDLHFRASGPIYALTLQAGGNVGVGTALPQINFEVLGYGQIIRNASASSYATLRLYNNTNNVMRSLAIDYSGSSYSGPLVYDGPAGESASIATAGDYPLTLGTANTMRVTVLGNGNVGIGTAAPDAKLAVKGTVHAQEVKVDLNGAIAPDYVFAKDYKLPSLEEIKAYIDKNNHLPEVPSAKEMEANGMNLGDMNLMLLRKVEEMTLYQIEAASAIEKLNARVVELEKVISKCK